MTVFPRLIRGRCCLHEIATPSVRTGFAMTWWVGLYYIGSSYTGGDMSKPYNFNLSGALLHYSLFAIRYSRPLLLIFSVEGFHGGVAVFLVFQAGAQDGLHTRHTGEGGKVRHTEGVQSPQMHKQAQRAEG